MAASSRRQPHRPPEDRHANGAVPAEVNAAGDDLPPPQAGLFGGSIHRLSVSSAARHRNTEQMRHRVSDRSGIGTGVVATGAAGVLPHRRPGLGARAGAARGRRGRRSGGGGGAGSGWQGSRADVGGCRDRWATRWGWVPPGADGVAGRLQGSSRAGGQGAPTPPGVSGAHAGGRGASVGVLGCRRDRCRGRLRYLALASWYWGFPGRSRYRRPRGWRCGRRGQPDREVAGTVGLQTTLSGQRRSRRSRFSRGLLPWRAHGLTLGVATRNNVRWCRRQGPR